MLIEQMTKRLHDQTSFEGATNVPLDDAIALHGAELGNIQLNAGGHLVIAAHRCFKAPFLEFFRKVTAKDGCACGRALRTGRTVIVPDIEKDEEFAPYRDAARAAGVRGVMTTPLLTPQGVLLGTVSTHFVNVHTPTSIEVDTIKSYSVAAANHLLELIGKEPLEAKALSMNRHVYEGAGIEWVH